MTDMKQRFAKNNKLLLSVLATLLVVGAVICIVAAAAGGGRSRNSGESHGIIKSACSSTLYPELCFSSITSELTNTHTDKVVSHKDVIQLALNNAYKYVERNYFVVEKLLTTRKGLSKRIKIALHDCLETIDDTLDSITKAKKDLQDYPSQIKSLFKHADDLNTLISTAITNHETCLDGFSHLKAEKRFRELYLLKGQEHAEHLCSNALAMTKNLTATDIAIHVSNKTERKLVEEEIKWPEWISAVDRRILQSGSVTPNVVVAADGSGNYKTVSAAVAAAPSNSGTRYVIRIKAGVYRENVEVPKTKTNIMFLGDGQSNTIITASRNVVDGSTTFNSATVAVVGEGFLARGVTFQNSAGPSKEQAVALRVGADLSAFYLCGFIAYQDTLYVHSNRQFFVKCYVAGTIDFIFGNSAVVLQDCDINARRPNPKQKNMVTAQGRVDSNQYTGIVIQKSRISSTQDLEAVKDTFQTYLGRPWKEHSRDMKTKGPSLLCVLSLATLLASVSGSSTPSVKPIHPVSTFNRSLFPPGFVFGLGTSAYQVEGASNVDGRGPCIWDTFTKKYPEKIWDHSSGNIGADFYHRYKSDIKLVKEIGLDSFRFSLSWTRIFPKGKGTVNPLGVKFYNNLINEILANGLTPFVTLFHWDFPQALEDEYGGFLSSKVVVDFRRYADFCYKTFGDRVKHWVTLNEPFSYTLNGYNGGTFAPGRCSNYTGTCSAGDSATEPYIVGHNLLLAHEAAATLYKTKYQARQKGQIGISNPTHYFLQKSEGAADHLASLRALDFFLGWFTRPVIYGEYPESMRTSVGNRLPKFTKAESERLKKSIDFLGVNYYSTYYASHAEPVTVNRTFYTDIQATLTTERYGVSIGKPTALSWLYVVPEGINYLLYHIKETYNNPKVYITENGVADKRNDSIPINEARKDALRIRYLDGHLKNVLQSIKEGSAVKGYYGWSFSDSYEWDAGYTVRFGLIYVDYKNNLRRYPKYSAFWLKKFLLK